MSDDELNWQKNVKPIKCEKVTLKADHKVNVKSIANRGTSDLQKNFLNTNNGNLSFCLDYNTKLKVDRGKYFISDKLDLHGYNIEDAYCKLIDFIIKNYRVGSRCLLIITGHGSATGKIDTIKNNLNNWLNDTKIQHMVLYHQQATKKHGGKGAFYVLLRKNKDLEYF
ncbi:DNA mismatch repair protein MutS [Wolbachia endosymbiont of Atemnus politus]|uniref:Smr/MutS family protein n=1 Tax=Wolbachia endosymbiont of Atemnus politus TaxID=2682840 RepID=UPI001573E357|nr:Smr/MutS family protein [Wolbachia endosymbiont of Atemnus politus]NSM57095.1 DNA mismatch repair protein MutS [Wolbachia endosymbiont of Atemnus politus]NSX83088.1 DNA mismatch repair protein MutS [Wolbachia endosymbiont of Atemnus politus]